MLWSREGRQAVIGEMLALCIVGWLALCPPSKAKEETGRKQLLGRTGESGNRYGEALSCNLAFYSAVVFILLCITFYQKNYMKNFILMTLNPAYLEAETRLLEPLTAAWATQQDPISKVNKTNSL